jgi:hypothetical protein
VLQRRDEPLGEVRGPQYATTGFDTAFVFLRFLSHLLNVSGKQGIGQVYPVHNVSSIHRRQVFVRYASRRNPKAGSNMTVAH